MKRGLKLLVVGMIAIMLCACNHVADTTTWQEQYDLGVIYLFDGNYEEAIIVFEAAIKLEPKQASIYVSLADAYREIFDTNQAIENLQIALILDDTLTEAYLKLADIYILLGEYEQAVAILQQGIETTQDKEMEFVLRELQSYIDGEEIDIDIADAQIRLRTLDGRRGQISVTFEQFPLKTTIPKKTYDNDTQIDNGIFVSFSDGNGTFSILTNTTRAEEAYEIYYPQDEVVRVALSACVENGVWYTLENEKCTVSRTGNTLTWNFVMPEWGFALNDVEYVGYWCNFFENYNTRGAVYKLIDGKFRVLDQVLFVEDLGFYFERGEIEKYKNNF